MPVPPDVCRMAVSPPSFPQPHCPPAPGVAPSSLSRLRKLLKEAALNVPEETKGGAGTGCSLLLASLPNAPSAPLARISSWKSLRCLCPWLCEPGELGCCSCLLGAT